MTLITQAVDHFKPCVISMVQNWNQEAINMKSRLPAANFWLFVVAISS
jgi:hypothetical protein